LITLKNISKTYNDVIALAPINATFEAGQSHVLLGSSGSGKSTLIKIVMGLVTPDQGEVEVNNITINPENRKSISQKIGYVIQSGGLFPHMTIENNITLLARLQKKDQRDINERIDELIQLVDLDTNLLSRYPSELSGGQKQRVSLVRALFLDPDILLLDEPLGALDPIVRINLQTDLRNIFNKMKKTVLIVTHDLAEASYFGHTISLFEQGNLVQQGNFSELINNPASDFVTKFIGAQRPPPELSS
jgi:osmoprotectant transport system ATP-binding protein